MSESDTEGKAPSALVVVDMINPYDFPDADAVAEHAPEAVANIKRLLDRCRAEGVRIIYVNDNYGDWNSSSEELLQSAMDGRHPELVEPLAPQEGDAFVIKARHSIFYSTPLEYLLATQGLGRVVLTGQVTEQCILYSALDGYIRHFDAAVVADACAHIHEDLAQAALKMMEVNMSAEISTARDVPLA